MKKQSLLYKISYTALFTALTVILSRFFAIPGLFGLPFLKISFANSVVIFSSFYLGPFWGMIVGGAADVLGAVLFPQGGGFNPIYTIPALLTGLAPYYLYKLSEISKLEKKIPTFLIIILSVFFIFTTIILFTNDQIISGKTVYVFTQAQKITFVCLILCFSIFYIGISIFIRIKFKDKKINQEYNMNSLLSSIFLTYMLIKIPISSAIKTYMLNYDFLFVLFLQLLTGFFTCLVHSVIVIFALNIASTINNRSALLKESQRHGGEEKSN